MGKMRRMMMVHRMKRKIVMMRMEVWGVVVGGNVEPHFEERQVLVPQERLRAWEV